MLGRLFVASERWTIHAVTLLLVIPNVLDLAHLEGAQRLGTLTYGHRSPFDVGLRVAGHRISVTLQVVGGPHGWLAWCPLGS